MATYQYDDFRVTLTPRTGSDYQIRALAADGGEHVGRFQVPLSDGDLERAVLNLARAGHTRRASGTDLAAEELPTRDVGGEGPPRLSAVQLGAALADALLRDEVGRGYDAAAVRAADAGRGLRLSLSLAGAPALLHLPWEFLYRRPRFLASQRHSPLIRHLDTGSLVPPPSIERTVRMLGVISAPLDLRQLDVEAERRRVEQSVAKVVGMGRVELEWLDPASPRRLRQALRDDSFHIVHYVGHSAFTDDGEGVLFLEGDDDHRAVPVDSTALANLLSDQNRLRLVVLNSCEGARTSVADPYAGVATTLIQLGVPAVVAMQFEISDRAAIVFAEELYTNLIGRQDPIDAAVAEARKAVYIEVDKVEWATPVLFMRHPDVDLFRFEVDAAPLPPTPPPDVGDACEVTRSLPPPSETEARDVREATRAANKQASRRGAWTDRRPPAIPGVAGGRVVVALGTLIALAGFVLIVRGRSADDWDAVLWDYVGYDTAGIVAVCAGGLLALIGRGFSRRHRNRADGQRPDAVPGGTPSRGRAAARVSSALGKLVALGGVALVVYGRSLDEWDNVLAEDVTYDDVGVVVLGFGLLVAVIGKLHQQSSRRAALSHRPVT